MIQVFQSTKFGAMNELEGDFNVEMDLQNKWLHLTNPTDKEIELVERATGINEDLLKAALDEEERARIETDEDNKLVLFDIPVIEEETTYFSYYTVPLGVVYNNKCIVTICLKENSIIHRFVNGGVKGVDVAERRKFMFEIMYSTHTKYLQYLRQIDKSSQRIQVELHKSTKNKELIQLLDLENSLVYFSTSLRGNSMVIERLIRLDPKTVEEETDLLEDVSIENRQALDMCNIYREILSSTTDAYASVISNNLNIIMRVLTTITVIISVPTLIASFWGMNTGVPFQNQPWGFWVVLGISAVATGISAYLLYRDKSGDKKKRK